MTLPVLLNLLDFASESPVRRPELDSKLASEVLTKLERLAEKTSEKLHQATRREDGELDKKTRQEKIHELYHSLIQATEDFEQRFQAFKMFCEAMEVRNDEFLDWLKVDIAYENEPIRNDNAIKILNKLGLLFHKEIVSIFSKESRLAQKLKDYIKNLSIEDLFSSMQKATPCLCDTIADDYTENLVSLLKERQDFNKLVLKLKDFCFINKDNYDCLQLLFHFIKTANFDEDSASKYFTLDEIKEFYSRVQSYIAWDLEESNGSLRTMTGTRARPTHTTEIIGSAKVLTELLSKFPIQQAKLALKKLTRQKNLHLGLKVQILNKFLKLEDNSDISLEHLKGEAKGNLSAHFRHFCITKLLDDSLFGNSGLEWLINSIVEETQEQSAGSQTITKGLVSGLTYNIDAHTKTRLKLLFLNLLARINNFYGFLGNLSDVDEETIENFKKDMLRIIEQDNVIKLSILRIKSLATELARRLQTNIDKLLETYLSRPDFEHYAEHSLIKELLEKLKTALELGS